MTVDASGRYSAGEMAVLSAFENGFGTTAPSGASDSGYTNNSSGYQILSTGSSGEAVIVVRGAFNYSGLSRYAYNYLYAAPTALYRKITKRNFGSGLSTRLAVIPLPPQRLPNDGPRKAPYELCRG